MKKDITLEEVMITPLFETNFNNALRDIEQRRANVIGQGNGFRLKSSAYSSLKRREMINLSTMVWELDQILKKTSDLPSIERQWIEAFMRGVVAKTLEGMRRLDSATSAPLTSAPLGEPAPIGGCTTPRHQKKTKKNEQNN
ncbi:MAG: hypothetical protein JW857_11915 [Bacteroidales bacterium]|nr:hypothetical protein [Bacteroidales bacterium]MBN2747176.1 hypothetical protein [Bacteroidales bacterium]